jgi:hypothetical protein
MNFPSQQHTYSDRDRPSSTFHYSVNIETRPSQLHKLISSLRVENRLTHDRSLEPSTWTPPACPRVVDRSRPIGDILICGVEKDEFLNSGALTIARLCRCRCVIAGETIILTPARKSRPISKFYSGFFK